MADILPFCGYRYSLKTPEELGNLVSPPYDMLDAESIDALHKKDPRNVIRIIQNRRLSSDAENRARHARAAALLRQWMEDNTLLRDNEPGVYAYRQSFDAGAGDEKRTVVRTGITVLVRLVDFSENIIQPHENTLSGPKVDRYELLEETKTNTELIFGLVSDHDGMAYKVISSAADGIACGKFVDFRGVTHELARCTDKAVISRAQEIFRNRTVLIADGHHRYETSLKYARDTKNPAAQHVMMTLVSQADPGLVIRPFHRMVKKCGLSARFTQYRDLSKFFTLSDFGPAVLESVKGFLDGNTDFEMLFADASSKKLFGLTTNSDGLRYLEQHSGGMSSAWNSLSVSKINRLCVEGIMEQKADGTVLHDVFEYTESPSAALSGVLEDPAFTGCLFIRPLDIAAVRDIVAAGERMPQKSTNFFPKLFSGLVFNRMDA